MWFHLGYFILEGKTFFIIFDGLECIERMAQSFGKHKDNTENIQKSSSIAYHQFSVSKERQKGCEENMSKPKRITENVIQKSGSSNNVETSEASSEAADTGSNDNDIERNKRPSDSEEKIGEPERHTEMSYPIRNQVYLVMVKAVKEADAKGSNDNDIERNKRPSYDEEKIGIPEGNSEIITLKSSPPSNGKSCEASEESDVKGSPDNDIERNRRPSYGEEKTGIPEGKSEILTQKSSSSSNCKSGEASEEADVEGSCDNDIEGNKHRRGDEENIGESEGHREMNSKKSSLSSNGESSGASEEAEAKRPREGEENIGETERHSEIVTQKSSLSTNSESGEALHKVEDKGSVHNGSEGNEWQKEGEHITDAELLELVTDAESKLSVPNERREQSKENVGQSNENIQNIIPEPSSSAGYDGSNKTKDVHPKERTSNTGGGYDYYYYIFTVIITNDYYPIYGPPVLGSWSNLYDLYQQAHHYQQRYAQRSCKKVTKLYSKCL